MKKLRPYLLSLLFTTSFALAKDNFPYNNPLNLNYGIEGHFINEEANANIKYDINNIEGIAEIPLTSIFLKDIPLHFLTNLENSTVTENGRLSKIPEGYMGLMDGLFNYMKYIHNTENPQDTTFQLYIKKKKKNVSIDIQENSPEKLELRVLVHPKDKKECLVVGKSAKIREIEIYFKNGIPIEAYATVKVLGIFPIKAHAYKKP